MNPPAPRRQPIPDALNDRGIRATLTFHPICNQVAELRLTLVRYYRILELQNILASVEDEMIFGSIAEIPQRYLAQFLFHPSKGELAPILRSIHLRIVPQMFAVVEKVLFETFRDFAGGPLT